jgi:sugar lactone lactonase YvrE
LLSLSGPAQALVADSTRGVAYLVAQDPYSACPSCAQYDYDMVVINGTTANGGTPIEIKSTTTMIEGSPYSSGVTHSSLAVDPNTGKAVFADAVDAYFTLYNPNVPSYEAVDHVSLGWIPNAVAIDTANSLAYLTDSQYNNVQVVGLATVLSNTAFGFSTNLSSGTQGGNSCGFLANVVVPDPTVGEVYFTTCTVSGNVISPQLNMLQYQGFTVNGTTLTPNFTCGYGSATCPPLDFATLPQANTSLGTGYAYTLNVDTSKHSVYLGNGAGNNATSALSNILVFNGPYPPAARPQQAISATTLGFGSVGLGTNPAKTFSFTNNGTGALLDPVVTISGTNATDFAFTDGCAGGIAANGFCVDQIAFSPSLLASESATAVVIDNSPDVPETLALSGTGVLPVGSGITPSSTLLQVSKLQVAPGAALSLYATISPAIGSAGEQVFFLDNTTNPATLLGTGTAMGNSVWSLSISTLAAGTHPLTAYYPGDNTYAPSTSLTVNVVISATGTGPSQPLLSFTPGSFYKPQSGSTTNYSNIAIDSAGDEFVLDSGVGSVTEYTVGGTTTAYLAAGSTDQGSLMNHPMGIAVAPNGGTVYIADTQNSHIATSTSAGSFVTPMQIYGLGACNGGTPTSFVTLSGPTGISIGPPATPTTEPSGSHVAPNSAGYDLYVADTGNKRVLQINPVGGNTAACGFYPGGVLDAILAGAGSPSGPALVHPLSVVATGTIGSTNVFIADAPPGITNTAQGSGTIYMNGTALANTGQIVFPYSLATDAAGDLYYSDQSLSQVWRYDISGNFLLEAGNGLNSTGAAGTCTSASPCEATQNGILTPYGLAVSGNGSIFIGDAAPTGQFGEVNVTTGLVTFPGQPTSSTSNPITVTVTDTASMAVGASGVSIGGTDPGDFAIAGGSCNTTAFTLQPGKSCTILVTFTPQQQGTRTAAVNLTTQSEIYGGTTQSINLTGNGAPAGPAPQTISFPPPPRPVTYGTGAVALAATASSGLGVTYNVTGPGVLSGNTVGFTGAGTVKIVASQAGNGTTYAAASSIEQDIQVLPATLLVTSQPANRLYDGTDPAFVDSITGFIPPDTLASIVTGSPSFSVSLDLGTTPANTTLTVNPALGTLALNSTNPDSADYVFSLGPGTLSVVCCEVQGLLPGSLPPANFPIPVGAPFALTAASTTSLPVSFTVLSGPGTITLNPLGGSVLTAFSTGLITVQAYAPGNGNIAASPMINLTFLGQ